MKVFNTVMKILAALAAVAGAVYLIATYGDKLVAWAKKLLNCSCCCCGDDECCCEDGECCCEDGECCCEDGECECCCEDAEEEEAEEAPAEEAEEAPTEADFEN